MHYYLSQFRWYRKNKGGEWVHYYNAIVAGGWVELEKVPKSCGMVMYEYENHTKTTTSSI
jgi:hypothetical protein